MAYSRQVSAVLLSVALLCGPAGVYAQSCAVDAPAASATIGTSTNALGVWEGDTFNPQPDFLSAFDGKDLLVRNISTLVYYDDFTTASPAGGATPPVALDDQDLAVFASQTNGAMTRVDINPLEGGGSMAQVWTKSLRRASCASDSFSSAPVIHFRRNATMAYKAAFSVDHVYVGTQHQCGSTTSNMVYALNTDAGTIQWTFNGLGNYAMDAVLATPELGGPTDTLFVTSERTISTQDSVWAINVLNGSLNWSVNAGGFWASPRLNGSRLYVANLAGELKALDATADGTAFWSINNGGLPFTKDFNLGRKAPYDNLIVLIDYYGQVTLARDDGTSGTYLWTTTLDPGFTEWFTSPPLIDDVNGYIYVGASDGKLYQLDIATGAVGPTRVVSSAGSDVTVITFGENHSTLYALTPDGTLAKFCFPFMYPPGTLVADGDINTDGLVNTADVLLATQAVVGTRLLNPVQFGHGDVAPLISSVPAPNGDFGLADALLITRKAIGVINF